MANRLQRMTAPQKSAHHKISRWEWMAGSAAAASAASSAIADNVQIALNQQLSSDGTGGLSADVTGDGIPDLLDFETFFNSGSRVPAGLGYGQFYNSVVAKSSGREFLFAKFSSRYSTTGNTPVSQNFSVLASPNTTAASFPRTLTALHTIAFTDARINNGAETFGFLEHRASSEEPFSNSIAFVRLVFDDSSTEPPDGVMTGGTDPEFVPPVPADNATEKAQLLRKIKLLKRKIKRAKRAGNTTKVRKLKKKLRTLKQRLRLL